MLTPAELRTRLKELDISLSDRALTDWRSKKGLIPPLRQIGLRGGGSKHFWDDGDAVLEQAIAAECLLRRYTNTSAALFGLWLSGYPVDAERAQRAWIDHLERQKVQATRAAPRYKDGYLGIGKSVWRSLGKPLWMEKFLAGIAESSFDDVERDDEGYRATVASLLNEAPSAGASRAEVHRLFSTMICDDWDLAKIDPELNADDSRKWAAAFKEAINNCIELIQDTIEPFLDEGTSGDDTFRFVDAAWVKANLPTILILGESIESVRSMTTAELDQTRKLLAAIRKMTGHCVELTTALRDTRLNVLVRIAFMASAGPFIANQLIQFSRNQPEWPMAETISAIHDFVMRVQSIDIYKQNDKYQASQRVLDQWTTTRQELSQLWAAATKNNEN